MRFWIRPVRELRFIEQSIHREAVALDAGIIPDRLYTSDELADPRECAVIVLPDITNVPLFTLVRELTRALATTKAAVPSKRPASGAPDKARSA